MVRSGMVWRGRAGEARMARFGVVGRGVDWQEYF